MRTLDQTINRGRNKTQKQYEQSMWEKHAFVYLGIVQSYTEKEAVVKLIPSISYDDYDMKKGFTKVNVENPTVVCMRTTNLDLLVGDIAVIVFTDLDSRKSLDLIRKGENKTKNFNVDNKAFHDFNFGIIISKVII